MNSPVFPSLADIYYTSPCPYTYASFPPTFFSRLSPSFSFSNHPSISFPFLGSGPKGVDDLCFHIGEFFPHFLSPHPNLQAHISASRDLGLKTGIWALRLGDGLNHNLHKQGMGIADHLALFRYPFLLFLYPFPHFRLLFRTFSQVKCLDKSNKRP